MATEEFVIDGICRPYNFLEENLKGRFGRILATCCMLLIRALAPPRRVARVANSTFGAEQGEREIAAFG